MTEEPNESKPEQNQPQPQTEKLLIDDPLHFQFHAAYLVYEETFEHAGEEARQELNQNIEDLKSNKIDCETFYQNISRYRHVEQMTRQGGKFTVATQRKKDWRKKTQRQERIKRHKK